MKFAIASLLHGHDDSLIAPIATHNAARTFLVVLQFLSATSTTAALSLLALIESRTRPSLCSCNIYFYILDVPSLVKRTSELKSME